MRDVACEVQTRARALSPEPLGVISDPTMELGDLLKSGLLKRPLPWWGGWVVDAYAIHKAPGLAHTMPLYIKYYLRTKVRSI